MPHLGYNGVMFTLTRTGLRDLNRIVNKIDEIESALAGLGIQGSPITVAGTQFMVPNSVVREELHRQSRELYDQLTSQGIYLE